MKPRELLVFAKIAILVPTILLLPNRWVHLWFDDKKTLMKEVSKTLGAILIVAALLGTFIAATWYSYHVCATQNICPEALYLPKL